MRRALLREELPGLGPDDDVERPQVLRHDGGPRVEVERAIARPEGDAETTPGVDLRDRTAGVHQHPGRSTDTPHRLVDGGQRIGEIQVPRVDVDGVDREVVPACDVEGRLEPLRVDPELRRTISRVGLTSTRERGPDPRVDPNADRRTGRAPPHPVQLGQQIHVQVDAGVEDGVQVPVGEVRPRVADLRGLPPVVERPSDLPRRADIHPDALCGSRSPERSQVGEEGRLALCLQREADSVPESCSSERSLERACLLLDADEVVHVERCSMFTRDRVRVAACDREAAGPDLQSGPPPPRHLRCRALHAGGKATRT